MIWLFFGGMPDQPKTRVVEMGRHPRCPASESGYITGMGSIVLSCLTVLEGSNSPATMCCAVIEPSARLRVRYGGMIATCDPPVSLRTILV